MSPSSTPGPATDQPRIISARSRRAAGALAALRSVHPDAVGVAGELHIGLKDEIARWSQTMQRVSPDLRRSASSLERELRRTIPRASPPRIRDGDFRLGNILFEGPAIRGIIDWEIWALTDPRVDVGWFLVLFEEEVFGDLVQGSCGTPSPPQLLKEYEQHAGTPVKQIEWFIALAAYKM